jgi:hypothetical protein
MAMVRKLLKDKRNTAFFNARMPKDLPPRE